MLYKEKDQSQLHNTTMVLSCQDLYQLLNKICAFRMFLPSPLGLKRFPLTKSESIPATGFVYTRYSTLSLCDEYDFHIRYILVPARKIISKENFKKNDSSL